MNGAVAFALFPGIFDLASACRGSGSLDARFGTEERCRFWFERVRWPGGFRCPRCSGDGTWIEERRAYRCRRCRKMTSLTAGTLLHGTRKPLRTWIEAVYLIVQRGVNARVLQRELGLTYKVAWMWGHKLRGLLAKFKVPDDERPGEQPHGDYDAERVRNGPSVRPPSPGEPGPCGCARIRARDWAWASEWAEERAADRLSRRYEAGVAASVLWPREAPLPGTPRDADTRASWELLATYSGSLSEKHLRAYLDEVAFRYNRLRRRIVESFELIVPELISAPPRTYRAIVAKLEPEGHALSIYNVRPRRFAVSGWRMGPDPTPKAQR